MPENQSKGSISGDRILITGASGGLGSALALHYARPGRRLLLWGRDERRLATIAEACRQAGADATIRMIDLTDVAAAIAAIAQDEERGPIGIAILAAGLGDIRAPGDLAEDPGQVTRLGLVNFVAPCAMASALAARMATRKRGNIALIGSAAAFHALPFAATYAGSKAGLLRFAQALRLGVAAHGVRVTLISPGFIDTAAGRKVAGPKPFLLSPSVAAKRIADAIERGRNHAIFPWPFALLRIVDRLLPRPWRDRLLQSIAPNAD